MSDAKHSPEPWRVGALPWMVRTADGSTVANAARIVAAVNALAGVDDPAAAVAAAREALARVAKAVESFEDDGRNGSYMLLYGAGKGASITVADVRKVRRALRLLGGET